MIDDPRYRFMTMSILNVAYAHLHTSVEPFVNPIANAFESCGLAVLSLISIIQLTFRSGDDWADSSLTSAQTAISCLVLIPLILMFVVLIARFRLPGPGSGSDRESLPTGVHTSESGSVSGRSSVHSSHSLHSLPGVPPEPLPDVLMIDHSAKTPA